MHSAKRDARFDTVLVSPCVHNTVFGHHYSRSGLEAVLKGRISSKHAFQWCCTGQTGGCGMGESVCSVFVHCVYVCVLCNGLLLSMY